MNKPTSFTAFQLVVFISAFFLPFIAYAQKNKTYYFYKTGQATSRSEFKKEERKGGLGIHYAKGDSMIYKIVPRKEKGQLDSIRFIQLKAYLEKIDSNWIAPDETIVISFFPGRDACNEPIIYDSLRFTQNFYHDLKEGLDKQKKPIRLIYLFEKGKGTDLGESAIPWREDKDELVEKIFFKYHYPCNSSVVIDTKGNYRSYLGEHSNLSIIKTAKALE